MFTVDNKFEIGQEVHVINMEKKTIWNKKTCDMCLGAGRIVHRGYNVVCPMCNGDKDITLDYQRVDAYAVDPDPHTITSMRYSITKSGMFLRYRVKGYMNVRSLAEDMIFATKEEAIAACEKLNEQG
ncbi:hypothetical protein ACTNEW_03745 [Blautia sp. HCP3S3_G3]|uniref:hypothetical protein n=1 Tax=Blautia sp. HCP3S3_G3 TaxID=3438913 RepID=UPI003F8C19D2